MKKDLDTSYVRFELQDDLLIVTYKKGLKLSLDMVKEIVKTRLEFTNYQPLPLLIYNHGVVSIDKEARDYLSSDEGVRGCIAAAIVLDSPFGSFLGNFFLSVTKPKIPARIFSKEEAALKWLQQFKT